MRDRDEGRADPRVFGEGKQEGLVRHQEFQHAGEKAGLGGSVAQCIGTQPGKGEESAQMFGIARNVSQGFNGNTFRFLRSQSIILSESGHLFAFPKRIPLSLFTDIWGTKDTDEA